MPFYKFPEMEWKRSTAKFPTAPIGAKSKSVPGELMKVAVVRYEAGEGPNAHFHPNEEQFQYQLEGKMKIVLGDEERVVQPGDLTHIPRNVRHGVMAVGGPSVFFTCKSPIQKGGMNDDYNLAKDNEEVWKKLRGK